MRRLILAALIALIGVMPMAAQAQTQAQAATQVTAATDPAYPIYIGVGAIAGIVLWNLTALGVSAFPIFPGTIPAGGLILPEWNVAMSRVYAGTSAVIGGWIADSIYMDW